jgi:hypothetical protein
MLERNVGKKIRVILDPAYGFEGTLSAVTHEPSGIWLSDAEAIVLSQQLRSRYLKWQAGKKSEFSFT